MVLVISEESVSRMSSVFSLPGSLSSSVLSKESNHLERSYISLPPSPTFC